MSGHKAASVLSAERLEAVAINSGVHDAFKVCVAEALEKVRSGAFKDGDKRLFLRQAAARIRELSTDYQVRDFSEKRDDEEESTEIVRDEGKEEAGQGEGEGEGEGEGDEGHGGDEEDLEDVPAEEKEEEEGDDTGEDVVAAVDDLSEEEVPPS
jgi:hypothetical protein